MSAFINAARAATSRAVAIDDGSVFIEEVSFGAAGRHLQTGSGNSQVEILYTVKCGSNCNALSNTIKKLDAKNMGNIIKTINDHASSQGFGKVVSSTSSQMAANVPQPSFVDIIVPKCPPGMTSVGVSTRMQLIMSGVSCTDNDGCKNSPCGVGAKCFDVKVPNTGYKCADCPYGYGVATGGLSKLKPNAECSLNPQLASTLPPQPVGPVPSGTRSFGLRHCRCVSFRMVAALTGSGMGMSRVLFTDLPGNWLPSTPQALPAAL